MTCRHIFDEYGLCFECDQRRNEMTETKINVGDRITFCAPTRHSGARTATRKVVGFWNNGYPMVRYDGWSEFIVRPTEIKRRAEPTDEKPSR